MGNIRSSIVFSFAEKYLSLVLSLVGTMVLSRLLTPSDTGVYSLAAVWAGIAQVFRDLGVSQYIIQEKELTRDKIRAVYSVSFATSWSLALVIMLSGVPAARFYGEPRLLDVLSVLAFNFAIIPFGSVTMAYMSRELKFRDISIINLFSSLVSLAVRKAVEISCQAHNEVMKTIHPNMSELEIQGLQEYVHKKQGAEGVGYGSIVGSGENGCVLHYMENTKTKIGGSMLLMDVGAEYHGYTADVTRTIPADGKYSAEERAIYQLVYDAQEAAFKTLKNGSKFADASNAARETIAEGLVKLGILKDKKEVWKFYPHGLGHHIGLDVHDRGAMETLLKDMVITIEPGIYIPSNSDCDKKWWGIAVRIEDDLLITETGYELLSRFSPRKIEDVEKMISQKSALDNFKLDPLESGKKKGF